MMEAEMECCSWRPGKSRVARETAESRKRDRKILPADFRGIMILPTTWLWICSRLKCEAKNIYYLKPTNLVLGHGTPGNLIKTSSIKET
jgi:hypothetical protein